MSKLINYSHPVSQPCRSVNLLLNGNNIEHEYKYIDLMKGEHKTADILEKNPAGLIPFI